MEVPIPRKAKKGRHNLLGEIHFVSLSHGQDYILLLKTSPSLWLGMKWECSRGALDVVVPRRSDSRGHSHEQTGGAIGCPCCNEKDRKKWALIESVQCSWSMGASLEGLSHFRWEVWRWLSQEKHLSGQHWRTFMGHKLAIGLGWSYAQSTGFVWPKEEFTWHQKGWPRMGRAQRPGRDSFASCLTLPVGNTASPNV